MRIVTSTEIEQGLDTAVFRRDEREATADVPSATRPASFPDRETDLLERITAMIPAPTVGLWLTLNSLTQTLLSSSPIAAVEWFVFVGSWILCVAAIWETTKYPSEINASSVRNRRIQIAIATLAFPVWVYTIGGPFDEFAWYDPGLGVILLVLVSGFLPFIVPSIDEAAAGA